MPTMDDPGIDNAEELDLSVFVDRNTLAQVFAETIDGQVTDLVQVSFPLKWVEDFTEFLNAGLYTWIDEGVPEGGPTLDILRQTYAIYAKLIDQV